ncbi:MAG TPA: SecY-interacting protein [Psychromonas hadalis]|nr:SecY-interacting protein [Psychromonas hadalis]
MDNITQGALIALLQRLENSWMSENKSLPQQAFDKNWRSPCEMTDEKDGMISWKPVLRKETVTFNNIEDALEISLHPSISNFFCHGFSDSLPCVFEDHPIELVQVWNEDDFKMLQENMIAHFLMQKRLNQPASMFIASCSDEMQIISVLNETGQVQLENLGKGQEAILAESLAEFLEQLVPTVRE